MVLKRGMISGDAGILRLPVPGRVCFVSGAIFGKKEKVNAGY
jgi:hypothetical protein